MSMQTAFDVLTAAKRLIVKRGWTRGAWARDKNRNGIHYTEYGAKCFCMTGAVYRASVGDVRLRQAAEELLRKAIRLRSTCLAEWNDAPRRKKPQVLRAFDRAIALAKASP